MLCSRPPDRNYAPPLTSPGDQTLVATVTDSAGTTARIIVEHSGCAPGAIDATLRALARRPAAVAGRVSTHAGTLAVTPFAIACDDGAVVPELEAPAGPTTIVRSADAQIDPLDGLLRDTLTVLGDLSHRGLRFTTDSHTRSLGEQVRRCTSSGLMSLGRSIERLIDALVARDLDDAADAWIDAVARTTTAIEKR